MITEAKEPMNGVETALWQVRAYDAEIDAPTVEAWAKERGRELRADLLSPLGIVVERDGAAIAAAWMFLCVGAPVGILDKCLMRTGLSLGCVRMAARHCIAAFREIARAHGLRALYAYAPETIARELEKCGGRIGAGGLCGVYFQTC